MSPAAMSAPLSPHAIATIVLTIGALVLFSRDRIRLEYSCIAVLTVMVVIFELFPVTGNERLRGADFLAGFGNEALITICLLLVLAKGVEVSGALGHVGRILTRMWLTNRSLALLATLAVAAFVSAFANNTPIVVMLLPILVGVAHRIGTAPSKVLMPVGFAAIIGGMSTTIGSSTNLLVVSIAEDMGLERLQMFDFALPAVLAGSVGLLYLWVVLPHFLPDRRGFLDESVPRFFDSVITINENSRLAGKALSNAMQELGAETRIKRLLRGESLELVRLPTLILQAGDRLHINSSPSGIQEAQSAAGSDVATANLQKPSDERLAEIVVTRDSPLHMKRLSQLSAATLRDLRPIAWYRPGQHKVSRIDTSSDPMLRSGDLLLMQGSRNDIEALIDTSHLLIITRTIHVPRFSKAPLAVAIMAGVVVVAALGFMPIIASALCGVVLLLLSRCLTWNEAWSAVDTRLALVIVASLALGTAMVGTGAASFIAHAFVSVVQGLPAPIVLSALLLLVALLTEVLTNNAIAVIATPIAIAVALEIGAPPMPFVLAVLFGANMSYLTPIGYQTNLLVMSAGGYRFSDFFRGGLPLQFLLWLTLSFALARIYL